jgi:hypothetical protein
MDGLESFLQEQRTNEGLCMEAAQKAGHDENAWMDCDNGEFHCPTCPYRDASPTRAGLEPEE